MLEKGLALRKIRFAETKPRKSQKTCSEGTKPMKISRQIDNPPTDVC